MTEVKSEIKEEPLFSLKNFFRPTSKNVNLWCTSIKAGCITLITFSTTLLANSPSLAITMILLAVMIGGIAETFILFTREKPEETLTQAAVDIVEDSKGLENVQ